ncbi:unnamed protein product [Moneuplotes crassus]|uniref:Tr-type G domain-containing protein n=1 Tax=Euplotes crassus TaxID=5936 RepID=A0AAD2D5A7_EUPCR|nr:unnamed protein product [Moneuplotes crassus]
MLASKILNPTKRIYTCFNKSNISQRIFNPYRAGILGRNLSQNNCIMSVAKLSKFPSRQMCMEFNQMGSENRRRKNKPRNNRENSKNAKHAQKEKEGVIAGSFLGIAANASEDTTSPINSMDKKDSSVQPQRARRGWKRRKVQSGITKAEEEAIKNSQKMEEMEKERQRLKGKKVNIPEGINLLGLSKVLRIELNELMEQAAMFSNEVGFTIIDEFQSLRNDVIELLCLENEVVLDLQERPKKDFYKRPPIVTIMGHVDHGKTTLLDAFRNSNLVDKEFGAITQTTAAFSFETEKGHYITFIDTPGHEVFDGMRLRGAKATDIVIIVISAIEGIQNQTKEVFDLCEKFDLPYIIAINKVDREIADPDNLILDLADKGIELDEIGGDIPSAQISALNKTGLPYLEDKIIELAENLDLKEEHDCNAECLIVESNIDKDTKNVTASVVNRKGVLQVGDSFICGYTEGKVRYILEDKEEFSDIPNIKDMSTRKLFPGQSGRIGGFKELPDAGFPLYKVNDPYEAKFITSVRIRRKEREENQKKGIHTIDKKILNIDRSEKRKLYSGDQMAILSQLDLLDEDDVKKIEGQLKREERDEKVNTRTRHYKVRRREIRKTRLEGMLEKQGTGIEQEELTEEEIKHREEQKQVFAEILKGDTFDHQPIILKAPSSGALETCLKEVNKVIMMSDKVSIIQSDVGPINDEDITMASQANAIIFAFDVESPELVEVKAESLGVIAKTYKLIFKMTDKIKELVQDMEIGDGSNGKEEKSYATILQTFLIKQKKKENTHIAGLSVKSGTLYKDCSVNLYRNEKLLYEDLEIESLKVHNREVSEVKSGDECGLTLSDFTDIQEGDILRFYHETKAEKTFDYSIGISHEE